MSPWPAGVPLGSADGPRQLPLRSINHVSKVCSNVEASVAFYRDVLGFVVVKRPQSFNESFEGCWLWGYGVGLHLIKGQPVPRSSKIDPKADHLSFQADSLVEVEAALRRLGIPFERQQVVEDGIQVQQLFFHDPCNNMIEVCNCDCLPIIPLDLGCCQGCGVGAFPQACPLPYQQCSSRRQLQPHEEDEVMSDGSRDSLDSSRSEPLSHHFSTVASSLAAMPLPANH